MIKGISKKQLKEAVEKAKAERKEVLKLCMMSWGNLKRKKWRKMTR